MKGKWVKIFIIAGSIIMVGVFVLLSVKARNTEVQSGTISVGQHTESEFPDLATVTLTEAVQSATAHTAGKLLGVELESENGFLIYSVELVTPDNSIMDVKVDAGSGEVLAVDRDKADHENGNEEEDRDIWDEDDFAIPVALKDKLKRE